MSIPLQAILDAGPFALRFGGLSLSTYGTGLARAPDVLAVHHDALVHVLAARARLAYLVAGTPFGGVGAEESTTHFAIFYFALAS